MHACLFHVPTPRPCRYTKFPVLVPTSTPGYNATYAAEHLAQRAWEIPDSDKDENIRALASVVQSAATRGYLGVLADYLKDALESNPKRGLGERTTFYGLQRPPIGKQTLLRCSYEMTVDDVAPYIVPFLMTNASSQLRISVDGKNAQVLSALESALADTVVKIEIEVGPMFYAIRDDPTNRQTVLLVWKAWCHSITYPITQSQPGSRVLLDRSTIEPCGPCVP